MLGLTLAGAGACTSTHEPRRDQARPAGAPLPAPELDVPVLLSLSVDELSRRVGPARRLPSGFADPTLLPANERTFEADSTLFFRYRHLAIVAFFSPQTRRLNNLLLLGPDEDTLMSRARLRIGTNRYLVLPVFEAQRPTQLMGVRVLATRF